MALIAAALIAGVGASAAGASAQADQGAVSKALSKANFAEQQYLRRLQEKYSGEMLARTGAPVNTPYGSVGYNAQTRSYETNLTPLQRAISAAAQGNLLHENTVDAQAIQGQQLRERLLQAILANNANTQLGKMQFADANTMSNLDASGLLALDKLSSSAGAADAVGANAGTQFMRNGAGGNNLIAALQNAGRNNVSTATGGNAVPGMQLASQTNAGRVGNFANLADALHKSSQTIGTPSTADPYGASLGQLAAQKQANTPQAYAVAKQGLQVGDAPQQQSYTASPELSATAQGLGALASALAMYSGGSSGGSGFMSKRPQGIDTPYR